MLRIKPDAALNVGDAAMVTIVFPSAVLGSNHYYDEEVAQRLTKTKPVCYKQSLQHTCLSLSGALFLLLFSSGLLCETFAQNATPYLPMQGGSTHDRAFRSYSTQTRQAQEPYSNAGTSYSRGSLRSRPVVTQPVMPQQAEGAYHEPQLQIDIRPRARNRIAQPSYQPLPLVTQQAGGNYYAPTVKRSSSISVATMPEASVPVSDPNMYLPHNTPIQTRTYVAPAPAPVPIAPAPQQPVNMFPEHVNEATRAASVLPTSTMPVLTSHVPDTLPTTLPPVAATPVAPMPPPIQVNENKHITYYDPQMSGNGPALDQPIDALKVNPTEFNAQPGASLATPSIAPAPLEEPKNLTGETETILNNLPRDLFPATQTRQARGGFGISRAQTTNNIPSASEFTSSTTVGAKIAIKRQSIDISYELEKAYNALLQGSTEAAVSIYKNVLSAEPNNKNALFGLATTYHKLGMLAQARPLYGRLLEMDPYNKEVLNNFLAMVGEEAPESAILYLEQLKGANHEFSPIYAQLAQLYAKQKDYANAIDNMQQAVAISPENMVYKYNLAVLYDIAKDYRRAEVLYHQILDSGLKGEDIPASTQDIQERLIYLGSK